MNHIKTLNLLVMLVLCTSTLADELNLEPWEEFYRIVTTEGSIVLWDGSSTYVFHKDGKFGSGPYFQNQAASGRVISGFWNSKGIYGKWSWVNGPYNLQYKKITIHLGTPPKLINDERQSKFQNIYHSENNKLYEAYFFIDTIIEITEEEYLSVKESILSKLSSPTSENYSN